MYSAATLGMKREHFRLGQQAANVAMYSAATLGMKRAGAVRFPERAPSCNV